jgi:branched-chain amino acid transport system substrate-binding protein
LKNISLLVLFCVFICGCNNKIKVGSILPLTGDDYFCGQEIKNGAELAIKNQENLLNKKLFFVVCNDQSSKMNSIKYYEKLASDKNICAIIGGGNSTLSEEIAAISQKKIILPLIVPSASLKKITRYGENVFRIGFLDDVQGKCMAKLAANDLNKKKVAILYNIDSKYSNAIVKEFIKNFSEDGGKIELMLGYSQLENDFRTLLNKIKANNLIDAIFIPDYAYNAALIYMQAHDLGIDCTFFGTDTWEEISSQISDAYVLDDIYFCSHHFVYNQNDKAKFFFDEYKKKYSKEPSAFAALGFDSASILIESIKLSNSTEKNDILSTLKDINYNGVTGNITFNEYGDPDKELEIIKINNGKNSFYKLFKSNNIA